MSAPADDDTTYELTFDFGATTVADQTLFHNTSGDLDLTVNSQQTVVAISGVVDGNTVTGLNDTAFPLNSVVPDQELTTQAPYADLAGIEFDAGGIVYYLSGYESQLDVEAAYNPAGGYFSPSSGDVLTEISCFAAGTRIATSAGMVGVEELRIGDSVLTINGRPERIRWIGRRQVDCTRHPRPHAVWPVRIAAHCFGSGMPSRELHLSPDHAIYAEGALIPVKYLVNGSSISQEATATITYFHVELGRHDVLLAEGLPVESYLDTGDRRSFADDSAAISLHPAWGSEARDTTLLMEAQGYAPLVVTGPIIARLRARLSGQEDTAAA